MKHSLVILSVVLYLAGISLAHATQAFCSPDGSFVSVLFAEENGDKKDGEKPSPEEEECE